MPKAIGYIKSKLNYLDHNDAVNKFFNYFTNTWMNRYDPKDWNVSIFANNEDPHEILINRTNNPLERFNKKMNSKFPEAKPNMLHFVETIRQISEEYIQELEIIRRSKPKLLKKQRVIEPSMYDIPHDYYTFTI
jgi:hypothetical protein